MAEPKEPAAVPLRAHEHAAGAPAPLSERKPPREWRTRRDEDARRVPAPRVLPPGPEAHAPEPAPADSPAGAPIGSVAAPQPYVAPPPAPDDLPRFHGVDRLVVLVRDPWWIYAWWELNEGTLGAARAALAADATLVLRVYDVSAILWDGTNHHSFFDIEIHDLAGGWYVELGKPGASFVAEVGLRGADGRFLAILRSNFVTLPRDGMSDVVDEEWMVVEEDYRMLFDLAGGRDRGLASGDVQRLLEQRLRAEMASAFASRGPTSFGLSSPAARR
jgi:hypothetical protein